MQCVLLCTPDPELHYLLITTHHAVSDGLSCGYLHSEIVSICHRLLHRYSLPDDGTPQPIFPPAEQLLPNRFCGLSGRLTGFHLLGQLLLNRLRLKPDHLPVKRCIPVADRKTGLIRRTLSPQLSQRFVQRCYEEGVTTNVAIMAAMLIATSRSIQKSSSIPHQPVTLSTQLAVNLRRYLALPSALDSTLGAAKIQEQELAPLFSILVHAYAVNAQSRIWNLAREIKGKIRNNIRNRDVLRYFRCLRLLTALALRTPSQPAVSVSLSDVGKVAFPFRHGEFEIEDYGGAFSVGLFVGRITAIVSQFQERLTINFVFSEPALDGALAQQIVDDTIAQIAISENITPENITPESVIPKRITSDMAMTAL